MRTEIVALAEPPVSTGQHLLALDVPGEGPITLLAEPAGAARPEGHPLSLRPVTRVQMAELFALVERLDDPYSEPPPPASDVPESEYPFGNASQGSDDMMIDAMPSRVVLPNARFGVIESMPPSSAAASSGPAVVVTIPAAPKVPLAAPAPPAPPARAERQVDPRVGRTIAGKYVIEAPIGSGAAATVYRALHKDLRRHVAVKILHAENQTESQFIRRFKAEALTASKLEHVNVTRIIDFGQDGADLYLVMELIVGRTLEAILAVEGPLNQRRLVEIGIQVSRALVFAHGQGVIHRDIKPENIMIVADADDDGEPTDLVKVCDFGLAKLRDPGDDENAEITVSGMLCGSPAYMSPEQTRGDTLDARTDVYSLGVTLFEALTNQFPFEAFSINELFLKKCTEVPRRVSSILPDVDPAPRRHHHAHARHRPGRPARVGARAPDRAPARRRKRWPRRPSPPPRFTGASSNAVHLARRLVGFAGRFRG